MPERILVDIGSSTTKVYAQEGDRAEQLQSQSIALKEGFEPEKGLAAGPKEELLDLLSQVKEAHPDLPVEAYATALFRKMLDDALQLTAAEIVKTGVQFELLLQKEEGHYMAVALMGRYETNEPILIMNIGGGSTELTVLHGTKQVETAHLEVGVSSVLKQFPDVNEQLSGTAFEEAVAWVTPQVNKTTTDVKQAFNTGGELTWMRLGEYELDQNTLFKDPEHPVTSTVENFKKRNPQIWHQVTLAELEALMPENPTWMHGARAYLAVAEAICNVLELETLIPSDSNLINGIAREKAHAAI